MCSGSPLPTLRWWRKISIYGRPKSLGRQLHDILRDDLLAGSARRPSAMRGDAAARRDRCEQTTARAPDLCRGWGARSEQQIAYRSRTRPPHASNSPRPHRQGDRCANAAGIAGDVVTIGPGSAAPRLKAGPSRRPRGLLLLGVSSPARLHCHAQRDSHINVKNAKSYIFLKDITFFVLRCSAPLQATRRVTFQRQQGYRRRPRSILPRSGGRGGEGVRVLLPRTFALKATASATRQHALSTPNATL